MASLKETKGRIASVKSTLKITSAMKMVASAKLHRAQSAIENMLPYELQLQDMLRLLLACSGRYDACAGSSGGGSGVQTRATLGNVRGGTMSGANGGVERSETLYGDNVPAGEGPMPKLNFNAVAQGYTCDLVAEYLRSIGVKDMLVDIGEIYCQGLNPSGQGWTIGVDRPVDGNETPGADLDGIWTSEGRSCGIVTSGNYRKYYIRDGRKYAHTIDPRTGYPVTHQLLSATVTAESGAAADAYATYCMVLGLDGAKEFIESRPDLEGYLIYDSDGEMKEWASAGFILASSTSR